MDDDFEDVYAHPESSWHRILHKCMRSTNAAPGRASTSQRCDPVEEIESDDDPAITLQACAADMKQLWSCQIVQEYLKQYGLFMEEQSGL
jgi:hypothetical protein